MKRDDSMSETRAEIGIDLRKSEPGLLSITTTAARRWAETREQDLAGYQIALLEASGRACAFKGPALTIEAVRLVEQLAPDAVLCGRPGAIAIALRDHFGLAPGLAKSVGLDAWHFVNAAITAATQLAIGVTHYPWIYLRTRGDCGHSGVDRHIFAWRAYGAF